LSAHFLVDYRIRTGVDGVQVPLLFHALGYRNGFRAWLDGIPVSLKDLPEEYRRPDAAPFGNFSAPFTHSLPEVGAGEEAWYRFDPAALLYFETDIVRGDHQVRVEYDAQAWSDVSGWVTTYRHFYSLYPARFWKSFGSLEVVIKADGLDADLFTSMDDTRTAHQPDTFNWRFTSLPADGFVITVNPRISTLASLLIRLGPDKLALLLTIFLVVIHWYMLLSGRYRNPERKRTALVTGGSLLVPFFALLGYVLVFPVMDAVIGPEAGRHHGYVFLILIIYPMVAPIYWLLVWMTDRWFKSWVIRRQGQQPEQIS
ncbi:MAG: hypothetical protein ACKOAR_03090, partial [Bacteroidota bacterium]